MSKEHTSVLTFLFRVLVVETAQYNLVCSLPKDKTVHMAFSPKGTHLSTWEQYSGQ